MAIKNALLGGTDWLGGDILEEDDINGTFNAVTDGAPLKIDRGNSRVGINTGTTAPTAPLECNGTAAVTGPITLTGTITPQSGEPLGKITLSTSDASGGSDGDLWLKY